MDGSVETIGVSAAQQRLCEHRPRDCRNVGVSSLCQLTLPGPDQQPDSAVGVRLGISVISYCVSGSTCWV